MCAILDANCVSEVFGRGDRPEAGKKFFDWLNEHGKLVVGGKLRKELGKHSGFSQWYRQAINSGLAIDINDFIVNERTKNLEENKSCKSDDAHIIALAQVSKARLLYSKEINLHRDFGNSNLIKKPRGKVYSTLKVDNFSESHRKLLSNKNLCRN